MHMVGLELSIRCEPARRTELQRSLQDLCGEVVRECGSHECRAYQALDAPDRFLWLQWWRSQQHLEDYLASRSFRTLVGAVKVLATLESARIVDLQDSTSVFGAIVGTSTGSSGVNPLGGSMP